MKVRKEGIWAFNLLANQGQQPRDSERLDGESQPSSSISLFRESGVPPYLLAAVDKPSSVVGYDVQLWYSDASYARFVPDLWHWRATPQSARHPLRQRSGLVDAV